MAQATVRDRLTQLGALLTDPQRQRFELESGASPLFFVESPPLSVSLSLSLALTLIKTSSNYAQLPT